MRACNNLPQPNPYILSFLGLRKIVTCSHSSSQCLLVSTVFGTVSSLHPTSFFILNAFLQAASNNFILALNESDVSFSAPLDSTGASGSGYATGESSGCEDEAYGDVSLTSNEFSAY